MPSAYAWYRAGTASVTNGSPSVTGTSTAWIANAAEGDGISFDGGSTWYEVSSVTDNTTLTLSTSYAGATASGLTYAIDRRSTRRSMTSELYQVVSNLIQSAVRLYSTTGVPSNSIGSDGSLAFDSTAEKFYQKSAGSWDAGTSIRGYPGAAASVAVGSTTTLPSGSSAAVANSGTSSAAVLEFAIPMGVTGATGATGATGPAAWTTIAAWTATTAYTVGPPASVVTFGGETYVCTTSHTSTASFDQTKFVKVAAKGLDGTGSGDVVGPASSTNLNLAVFSGATGKLIADGGQTIAQVIAAASAVVPAGGTSGQVLRKATNADYALEWAAIAATVDLAANYAWTGLHTWTQQNKVTFTAAVANSITGAQFVAKNTAALGDGHATSVLDKGATAANAAIEFVTASSGKWAFGTYADDHLSAYDRSVNRKTFVVEAGAPVDALRVKTNGMIVLGGSTNLFPSLKAVGTELQARLADDSGYATLRAMSRFPDGSELGSFGVMAVVDEKASGDAGASATAAWQTRALNTVIYNTITGASLAANQVTLPAGTYEIEASAPGYGCGGHVVEVYNVTASAAVQRGTVEHSASSTPATQTRSFVVARVVLTSPTTVIELRHWTGGANGFGLGIGAGSSSITPHRFALMRIRKVA